jgi:hypothetical protein
VEFRRAGSAPGPPQAHPGPRRGSFLRGVGGVRADMASSSGSSHHRLATLLRVGSDTGIGLRPPAGNLGGRWRGSLESPGRHRSLLSRPSQVSWRVVGVTAAHRIDGIRRICISRWPRKGSSPRDGVGARHGCLGAQHSRCHLTPCSSVAEWHHHAEAKQPQPERQERRQADPTPKDGRPARRFVWFRS